MEIWKATHSFNLLHSFTVMVSECLSRFFVIIGNCEPRVPDALDFDLVIDNPSPLWRFKVRRRHMTANKI